MHHVRLGLAGGSRPRRARRVTRTLHVTSTGNAAHARRAARAHPHEHERAARDAARPVRRLAHAAPRAGVREARGGLCAGGGHAARPSVGHEQAAAWLELGLG